MGLNVLKTSPLSCSSRTFSSVLSNLIHSPPITLTTARLITSSSSRKSVSRCISSSGFSGSLRFEQSKRRFRGGVVVAMAAGSGSAPKSEEEWRAILSPEQFRILRQKGTELAGLLLTYTVTIHVKWWDPILVKAVFGEKQWQQNMKLRSSMEVISRCGK